MTGYSLTWRHRKVLFLFVFDFFRDSIAAYVYVLTIPRFVHPVSNNRWFFFLPSRTQVCNSLPFIRLSMLCLCVLPNRNAHCCISSPAVRIGGVYYFFSFLFRIPRVIFWSYDRKKRVSNAQQHQPNETGTIKFPLRWPCVSRLYACADSVQMCNYTPS